MYSTGRSGLQMAAALPLTAVIHGPVFFNEELDEPASNTVYLYSRPAKIDDLLFFP